MSSSSSLVISGLRVAYVVGATDPSEEYEQLASFAWGLAFALWVVEDARRRRQTPCFDFGTLVATLLPFALVWYVFWSRGWRGGLTLAAFIGLYFVQSLFAATAWVLKYGLP